MIPGPNDELDVPMPEPELSVPKNGGRTRKEAQPRNESDGEALKAANGHKSHGAGRPQQLAVAGLGLVAILLAVGIVFFFKSTWPHRVIASAKTAFSLHTGSSVASQNDDAIEAGYQRVNACNYPDLASRSTDIQTILTLQGRKSMDKHLDNLDHACSVKYEANRILAGISHDSAAVLLRSVSKLESEKAKLSAKLAAAPTKPVHAPRAYKNVARSLVPTPRRIRHRELKLVRSPSPCPPKRTYSSNGHKVMVCDAYGHTQCG